MSTNLLWAFPFCAAYESDTDAHLVTGTRFRRWTGAADTETIVYFYRQGTCDHLILARADLLVLADVGAEFDLYYSTDLVDPAASDYTLLHESGVLTEADLVGPNAQDYVFNFSAPITAYFWKLVITTTASTAPELAKVFIGQGLDFGRDPASITMKPIYNQFYVAPRREIQIVYSDITQANAQALKTQLETYGQYVSCFLYTVSNHDVLGGFKLIQCEIVEYEISPVLTISNDIRVLLREML